MQYNKKINKGVFKIKKKSLILIIVIGLIISLYALFIHSRNTIENLPLTDVNEVNVIKNSDNSYQISGSVILDKFETFAFVDAIEIDNDIYITLTKRFGFNKQSKFKKTLHFNHDIENIILIGGNYFDPNNQGVDNETIKNLSGKKYIYTKNE